MERIIDAILTRDKRAIIPSGAIKKLVSEIKLAGLAGDVASMATTLKTNKIGLGAFDTAMSECANKVSKIDGILHINQIPIKKFEHGLMSGDLGKLIKMTGSNVPIDSGAAKSFREVSGGFPHAALNDIDTLSNTVRPNKIHLDINLSNIDKLSPKALKETESISKKLQKFTVNGGKIAIVTGVVILGVNWLQKSLESRKGCFLVSTINNKATSCRLSRLTCPFTDTTTSIEKDQINVCATNVQTLKLRNPMLILIKIVNYPNGTPLKADLARHLSVTVEELNTTLQKLVTERFEEILIFIDTCSSVMDTVDICKETNAAIENGKIPNCRMCDPQADVKSTTFVDTSKLATNMTLHCESDPSLLDLLSDIAVSTGKNIFDNIWSIGTNIVKYGAIAAVFLLLILVVIFVYNKFIKGGSGANVIVEPAPVYVK